MKRLLLLFLFFISNLTFAQQQRKLDSLKAILAKLPLEGRSFVGDTTRVRVLCEMGDMIVQFDSSKSYYLQGLKLSNRIKSLHQECDILNKYGRRLLKQNNVTEAGNHFFKALSIAEKNNMKEMMGYSCRNICAFYSNLGNTIKALEYAQKGLLVFNQIKHEVGILLCTNIIGLLNIDLGLTNKAIYYFKEGINKNRLYRIVYFDGYFYLNIGVALERQKKYDYAIKNINNAITIFQKSGYMYADGMSSCYGELAQIYYNKKEYDKTIMMCKKSLKDNNQSNISTEIFTYNLLYLSYKNQKQIDSAFKYVEILKQKEGDYNLQTTDSKIESVKAVYDLENQKTKNELLNKDIENKNNQTRFLIGGVVVTLIILIVIFRNNIILNRKNKKIENQRTEILKVKSDLEVLNQELETRVLKRTKELRNANEELVKKNREIQDAMFKGQRIERKRVASELHDNLGSTLSAIKWRLEAIEKDNLSQKEQRIYEGIMQSMAAAYNDVRLLSHNLLPNELENYGLDKALQKFVDDISESKRIVFETNFEVKSKSSNKIELDIYSICLELINNILKHSKANKAYISVIETADDYDVIISDDGIGYENQDYLGKGLKNLEERIKSLNADFSVKSEKNNGTTYKFKIPIDSPIINQVALSN